MQEKKGKEKQHMYICTVIYFLSAAMKFIDLYS